MECTKECFQLARLIQESYEIVRRTIHPRAVWLREHPSSSLQHRVRLLERQRAVPPKWLVPLLREPLSLEGAPQYHREPTGAEGPDQVRLLQR